MRKATINLHGIFTGILTEDENGYHFTYDEEYLKNKLAPSVSLTMPVYEKSFSSSVFFPFFDGLIPEGWLLQVAEKNWKINPRDRMGLLLVCCEDCIGAVSVHELKFDEE